jgi:hypothetical protein
MSTDGAGNEGDARARHQKMDSAALSDKPVYVAFVNQNDESFTLSVFTICAPSILLYLA